MYIWMVLATFLAILYSFSLSYRGDIRELTVVPRAEAVVTKIVMKHRAAIKYMYDLSPPTNGQKVVTYSEGEVTNEQVKDYLPFGFNAEGSTEFTSMIYCMKKSSMSSGLDVNAGSCADADAVKYLVTYGCVPAKWRSISSGRPNGDMMRAMTKLVEYGNNFGYTRTLESGEEVKDKEHNINTGMVVMTREGMGISIPKYVINGGVGTSNNSFSEVCGNSRGNGGCPFCLVYLNSM